MKKIFLSFIITFLISSACVLEALPITNSTNGGQIINAGANYGRVSGRMNPQGYQVRNVVVRPYTNTNYTPHMYPTKYVVTYPDGTKTEEIRTPVIAPPQRVHFSYNPIKRPINPNSPLHNRWASPYCRSLGNHYNSYSSSYCRPYGPYYDTDFYVSF